MMSATKHPHKLSSAALAHLDELLDEALRETFPASDPAAIAVEFGSEEETGLHDAVGSRSGRPRRRPR